MIMKRVFTLLFFTTFYLQSKAQVFSYTNDIQHLEESFTETPTDFHIEYFLPGEESLDATWYHVETSFPDDCWDFQLCDNNICYFNMPPSADVLLSSEQISAGVLGDMKITITSASEGTGIIKFILADNNSVLAPDTISFTMTYEGTSCTTVNIDDNPTEELPYIYQSNGVLVIENSLNQGYEVHLVNLCGQTLDAFQLEPMKNHQSSFYNISQSEVVIVQMISENKQSFSSKILLSK